MNTNLTECEDCGKSVSINAETCPHCGMKLPTYEIRWKKEKEWQTIMPWLFVGSFLIGWIIYYLRTGSWW